MVNGPWRPLREVSGPVHHRLRPRLARGLPARQLNGAMIVAVRDLRKMEVAADEVIGVAGMRNLRVSPRGGAPFCGCVSQNWHAFGASPGCAVLKGNSSEAKLLKKALN